MYKNRKGFFSTKKSKKILTLSSICFLMVIISILPNTTLKSDLTPDDNRSNESITHLLKDANEDPYDFQGIEPSLDVTDYGNLYKNDQHISLTSQEELDLTYYL
ncbi:MAG: hypothetical protein ACFFBI_14975, partial [Promethearchaeota archaeon]